MRINILQHTPNEGPGSIQEWSHLHQHEMFVYHPYQFEILPSEDQSDLLVILGGPMSPNDEIFWIKQERELIQQMLDAKKPILGVCFGAQQISKTLGYEVVKAPHKEVGWAPVFLQNNRIPNIPPKMSVLHWHEDMFQIPDQAKLLFSSDLIRNQGFILNENVIGLQFHFEPQVDNVREMIINDGNYALKNNDLAQTPLDIMNHGVPVENQKILFQLLDFITNNI